MCVLRKLNFYFIFRVAVKEWFHISETLIFGTCKNKSGGKLNIMYITEFTPDRFVLLVVAVVSLTLH